MRKIVLFGEDIAHKQVIESLVLRLAQEAGERVNLSWECERGGSVVDTAFKIYLRELKQNITSSPSLIIIIKDGNRQGLNKRYKEVNDNIMKELSNNNLVIEYIIGIPDPHIERWLLLDSEAFKIAVGKGCNPPSYSPERDYYKKYLLNAIREAEKTPVLGGIEFAEEIVKYMNIEKAMNADKSFKRFAKDVKDIFKQWKLS